MVKTKCFQYFPVLIQIENIKLCHVESLYASAEGRKTEKEFQKN